MAQERHFRIPRWGGRFRSSSTSPPTPTLPGGLLPRQRTGVLRRAVTLASGASLVLGLSTLPAIAAPVPQNKAVTTDGAAAQVNVLVFHGPADKQDDPVLDAAATIKELGQKNGFSVDQSDDPSVFTLGNLARYRGVVFLSANGVTLNDEQEAAFQAYIKAGGGFVGVHDAAYAQDTSSWFTGLIGTRPAGSLPNPEKVVEITVNSENPPNEGKDKLIDGNNNTKWLARTRT
ncbi:MAG TPA: ThuA domain-containing protein, partial [Micromonospora sp.]|nr:ThuA domain-containing protein [Micromonospora sp.]